MTPTLYWSLTPRETFEWLQAATARSRDRMRQIVTGAWFAGKFSRGKLEPLHVELRQAFGADPDEKAASLEEYAERAKGFFLRLANREGGRYVVNREAAANG